MNANQILDALKTKHAENGVLVPECKDGPSQTERHLRLDAWVLLKTWSPITTVGYEIKVSRGDWLADEKFTRYMGLCHHLYVVTPKGLVKKEEVPAGVGLMECVGEACRLVTRRPAPRREVELPARLMVYVLMSRVKVDGNGSDDRNRDWRLRELRKWVTEKDDRVGLHWALSQKIQRRFEQQEARQRELDRRIHEYEHIEQRIKELGFDPLVSVHDWQVLARLNQLAGVVPWNLPTDIRMVQKALEKVATQLEGIKVEAERRRCNSTA